MKELCVPHGRLFLRCEGAMRPRSFAPLMARSRKGCAISSKARPRSIWQPSRAIVCAVAPSQQSLPPGMPIYRHAADQSAGGLPKRRRFPLVFGSRRRNPKCSERLMPVLTDTTLTVRCPYCTAGIDFLPMVAYKDGRFVCRDCGHTVRPGVLEYRCLCRPCLGLLEASIEV